MIFRYHLSIIPLIGVLVMLIVASFNNGFLTKFNSIDDTSAPGNPYIEEMHFESSEMKSEYENRWFIPQSKKIVVYITDGVPYYFVTKEQQQECEAIQKEECDGIQKEEGNVILKHKEGETSEKQEGLHEVGRMTSIINTLNAQNNKSVLLIQKSESYTMTTTRVKTFATGTIPGVIDIYNHFGQSEMTDDHIFKHVRDCNETSMIFGTSIWKVFFNSYIDSDKSISVGDSYMHQAYSPIYLNEIVELLKDKNAQPDWNVILFHDSSFDMILHTGDVFKFPDPYNNTVFNHALDVIDTGSQSIIDSADEDVTVFIMSDHGRTRPRAEHGGLTEDEINAFLFMYNKNDFILDRNISQVMNRKSLNTSVNQVDFVPTFCMLKGIAIPANNIGAIIPDAFVNLPWVTNEYIANCYYTNLRQIEDFFRKSYKKHSFPSKKTAKHIFEMMDKSKKQYQHLFEDKQVSQQKLAKFIVKVRLISEIIKEVILNEGDINFPQMKIAVASVILLVILVFVIQSNLEMIMWKQVKQNMIELSQKSKLAMGIIGGIVIVASVISTLIYNRYLMALNVIAVLLICLLIGYGIYFLRQLYKSHSENSSYDDNYQFIYKLDAQTATYFIIVASYPIFLTMNDFIHALDSIYSIILAGLLLLIGIHSLYECISGFKENLYAKIINLVHVAIKGLLILSLLHLAIYYDPKLIYDTNIAFSKYFVDHNYLHYFTEPLVSTYLPLTSLVIFYLNRIQKSTVVYRSESQQANSDDQYSQNGESSQNGRLSSHKLVWIIHLINITLCCIYFIFNNSFPDHKYFFDNFFYLSSFFLVCLQLIMFCVYSPSHVTFLDKYKLFYWSLIPPFLYLMELHSVMQVVIFFVIIFTFESILQIKNYRKNLFMYIILNLLCMIFYVASGHGFKIHLVKFTTSHLGMIFFNELQVTLNVLISNLSWFILAPLYFPFLLEDDCNSSNANDNYQMLELPQEVNQNHNSQIEFQLYSANQSKNDNNQIVDTENDQEKNQQGKLINKQNSQAGPQNSISSLYMFQIKILQNFNQHYLFYIIGLIPLFFHNIHASYDQLTDYFTFMTFLFLAQIALGLLFQGIFQILSKKMLHSIIYCQINNSEVKIS